MKTFETLLRMHRWQLDERRRVVKDLEDMRAETEGRIQRIDRELAQEAVRAQGETAFAFAPYMREANDRKANLARSLEEVDARLALAHEQLTEAFREAKKYERLLEERIARNRNLREQAAAQAQDEMSILRHARKIARRG